MRAFPGSWTPIYRPQHRLASYGHLLPVNRPAVTRACFAGAAQRRQHCVVVTWQYKAMKEGSYDACAQNTDTRRVLAGCVLVQLHALHSTAENKHAPRPIFDTVFTKTTGLCLDVCVECAPCRRDVAIYSCLVSGCVCTVGLGDLG